MEEKKYLVIDGKKAGIEDLTGRKFGRLTVIRFDEELYKESLNLYKLSNKDTHILKHNWLCSCECDKNKIISVSRANLIKGKTISCGCYKIEMSISRVRKNITKSFEDWCIENNRQDYLDLWDYELNNIFPNEVGFGSEQRFYFKCPNHIHNSELKRIIGLTRNGIYSYFCTKCNSFAQWGIDNICSDFLKKYWDYDKNTVNPWDVSKATHKKVWIKCQNGHNSYKIACNNFKNNRRCPKCDVTKGEEKILKILTNNNINHEMYKTYDNLLGMCDGLLSYDFYLPNYNLLIEYQGNFHDGSNGEYTQINLETQQEHDRRKRQYVKDNNIKLLEIWYWDYDNIEEILNRELKLN